MAGDIQALFNIRLLISELYIWESAAVTNILFFAYRFISHKDSNAVKIWNCNQQNGCDKDVINILITHTQSWQKQ